MASAQFPASLRWIRLEHLTFGVMAVLLVAGLLKLTDLSEFRSHLQRDWGLGSALAFVGAITIPVTEVLISGLWFARVVRPFAEWAALMLMSVFTALALVSWIQGSGGGCSCFGRLQVLADWPLWATVARNALLAVLCAVPILLRSPAVRVTNNLTSPRRVSRSSGGFSILELVVLVVIVTIIAALLIPAAMRSRERAREAATSALLRQHAVVFLSYAGDHRDVLPYPTDPTKERTLIRHSTGLEVHARYFEAWGLWPLALSDGYYQGSLSPRLWVPPSMPAALRGAGPGWGMIAYPCVFLAKAPYWRLETRLAAPAQLSPTGLGDVRFPDKKVILFCRFPREFGDSVPHPVAAVDGHASVVRRGAEPPQCPFGDGGWEPWSFHSVSTEAFMHTLDGVRAREF
jgi:type II secretory pathway pseudopilin PulG